jgi:glycosyltransferase involved in cell wall biosynthesis
MSVDRRLLLITYHFPPDPAVGGRRWHQFALYLAEHGWGIDVVTRDLGLLKFRDEQQVKLLPPGVRVLSAPEPESNLARLEHAVAKTVRRFVPRRAAMATPNASATTQSTSAAPPSNRERGSAVARAVAASVNITRERSWALAAAHVAVEAASGRRYDAVVSSGPPHFAHEGARRASRTLRLPLLIDLRDPWSAIERVADDYASPIWFSAARYYERRCVRDAALVIMNTDLSRDDMRRRFPDAASRIITIRNGSDDEERLPVVPPNERFSIRFAGSIYLDRDPRLVFRAAASVIQRLSLTPRTFALEFIGHVNDLGGQSVRTMAEQEGVSDFVQIDGPRPRAEAMRFLAGGSMLLNLPQDADMCVPAKIFEYVRFNAWLLVLATPRSATAEILRGTSADVIEPSDVDGIARAIESRYRQHARGEQPAAVGHDGRFNRAIQAKILLDQLNSIVPEARES